MSPIVTLTLSSFLTVFVGTTNLPPSGITDKIDFDINNKILIENSEDPPSIACEDSYLNITSLARKYGYSIEEHRVTTEDGYILGLHRLTTLNETLNPATRTPVFLMHGLLDSSDSWILQGPDSALAYLLVDKGYDVWMGNARGNKHSSSHIYFHPNEGRFWKFSWEEIGIYDLPAMIDHALRITNRTSLHYVGHSQGTTSFFVLNALKPEYNGKVKLMFALSPIAWLGHAESPLLKYLTSPSAILQYFEFVNALSPSAELLTQIVTSVCKVTSQCSNIFETLFGNNYYVSAAMLPVILGHSPTGSSVLQLVHFWQLYDSGRFRRFDYGWWGNLHAYGTLSPPDYDLRGITAPIVLFYSANDWLSHPLDVSTLKDHLPNVRKSYFLQSFNHIDYLFAGVARDAVYVKIIDDIQNFEVNNSL